MSKVKDLLYGSSGVIGVEIAGFVDQTDPSQIAEIGGIVIQIIIGIATVWKLLWPKKK